MATNAYLERMNQLRSERRQNTTRQLEEAGVPIRRPQEQQAPVSPSGVPTGEAPIPQEDESYKDTHFYNAFEGYKQKDPYFSGVMDEMTKLATGLREQVKLGYMPEQVARQRLTQFVGDTQQHFIRNKPKIQEEEKNRQMQALLGAITQVTGAQQAQQQVPQNQEIPPEGISPEQAAQMEGQ
ncbi:hypothetical protein NDAWWUGD_CDS0029 [Salmonella phage SeKF_80]|jgi:hypothetical protein|uniref:Uncharacterized protein n=2 Tax=Moazamivirus TaxID=3044766 RepID=G0X4V5_9CAUD|nr:hypothetical protein SaPh711_gp022 [Salmonella phage 7-11]YP_010672107.1 hypothetical protein PQC35_gp041 [Salmonella phage SE131]AEK81937.1 hypothetical protein [Salmonella phage 7-11]AVJ48258.1 hypothetical protein [Salmonella phage SE131]